jgi:hypothetical protein
VRCFHAAMLKVQGFYRALLTKIGNKTMTNELEYFPFDMPNQSFNNSFEASFDYKEYETETKKKYEKTEYNKAEQEPILENKHKVYRIRDLSFCTYELENIKNGSFIRKRKDFEKLKTAVNNEIKKLDSSMTKTLNL